MPEPLLTRYLQPLLAGRRAECFTLIENALTTGKPPEALVTDVVWPAMAQVDRLFRDDRINTAIEHMAARINRTVADQLQAHLPRKPVNGRKALLLCADEPREELGAQMVGDLFQADGWDVYFVGGGVPDDEVLSLVGQLRPDALIIFGTLPQGAPAVRGLISLIRDVNVCPSMNIIVSGGVFNRADGLWHEVGADEFADTAPEVLEIANALPPRVPGAPHMGIVKKRRRRRKGQALPTHVGSA